MKNDILIFHNLMRAMPLNRDMSVGEICRAAEQSGGTFSGEREPSVRRALQIDENVYFEHHASQILADASRQRDLGKDRELEPTANRAVAEYLAVLDDAAFGAATPVEAKSISPVDPAALPSMPIASTI